MSYFCYAHNWASPTYECPSCHKEKFETVTTTNTQLIVKGKIESSTQNKTCPCGKCHCLICGNQMEKDSELQRIKDNYEHTISCLLMAATNGKWSKVSDKDSMVRLIEDEIEEQINNALNEFNGEHLKGGNVVLEKELERVKAERDDLKGHLVGLCKEVEGFLNCHEYAISMDSGNSNMQVLKVRIERSIEDVKKWEGK